MGFTLRAIVEGKVVIGPVLVGLAIGFILRSLGNQILKGVTIMVRDVIDRGLNGAMIFGKMSWSPLIGWQNRPARFVSPPEGAHPIPVFIIALLPIDRKVTQPVTALAQVPGFGNDDGRAERRVLLQ